MPIQLRKLSMEETAKYFPQRGQMDLTEYAEALRTLKVGEAAEMALGGLTPRALKRRLGQAARQIGRSLKWARESSGDTVRFQMREAQAPKPRNGRRGRRKKGDE